MGYFSNVLDFKLDCNKAVVSIKTDETDKYLRVLFYTDRIIRITLGTEGDFKDAESPVDYNLMNEGIKEISPEPPTITLSEASEYYECTAGGFALRIGKTPIKLSFINKITGETVWEEASPLLLTDDSIIQTLRCGQNEYFYGGGMQNGYFSHKGRKLSVELKIKHWNDGSVSNPAPFYMSTAGYGIYRNTFSPGEYDFTEENEIKLSHKEKEFDCFYFYGPGLPEILDLYTRVTGRPTLIPRWGLWLGDADCYNTGSETYTGKHNKPGKTRTPEVLDVLARYRENNMPAGWVLPNDGYGCGYEDLERIVREAWDKYGFRTGLWTENGVEKIAHEVSVCGTRLCKLDVAWVGPGYKFALDASRTAATGIESNSYNADGGYGERAYVWSCCGWAGTQRYSAVWSGDQSGCWEYIRFHIPTYIGAGLSGICFAGSDIDGIFGGTAKTYTRDLQWKAFTPIMIAMSGWADLDKQPWVHGEPYASINRKYLSLRQRLTPYLYTLASESYLRGLPMVRAMLLEFPEDSYVWDNFTQYQFMCGSWILAAPVFTDTEIRDSIYLPRGEWTDYHTGKRYKGGRIINNYNAPLDIMPLFIRDGAIIPMDAEKLYDGQEIPAARDFMTLDIYPSALSDCNTSFSLYEDDGHTTLHRKGEYSTTLISCGNQDGKVIITIDPVEGSYKDMPFARKYELVIHSAVRPDKPVIRYGDADMYPEETHTKEDWMNANCCSWYFDPEDRGGVLYIKTKSVPLHEGMKLVIDHFEACPYALAGYNADDLKDILEVPSGLKAAEVTDNTISLTWDASEADYYEVEVIEAGLKALPLIYTNLTDGFKHTGLKCLNEYSYRVRAVKSGKSASRFSEAVKASTLDDQMKNAVPYADMYAYATSEFSARFGAKNLVDGEKATFWVSDYDKNTLPQSITVDFGKIHEIDKLVFTPRYLGARTVITEYELYTSVDGRNFKRIIENGAWEDDGDDKELLLNGDGIRSVRLKALGTSKPEFSGAGMALLTAIKKPGSQGVLPGDYTGDGKVDIDDLNFVLQYYCFASGDNSWQYVSKADTDGDGRIGVFDIAYTAAQISPKALPTYDDKASGTLGLEIKNTGSDELSVLVSGVGVTDLYAFEFKINVEGENYSYLKIDLNRDIFKHTATFIKDGMLYATGTLTGNAPGVSGDVPLAAVTLKSGCETLEKLRCSAVFVGTNLDIINVEA